MDEKKITSTTSLEGPTAKRVVDAPTSIQPEILALEKFRSAEQVPIDMVSNRMIHIYSAQ